jgi:hypothetical protein
MKQWDESYFLVVCKIDSNDASFEAFTAVMLQSRGLLGCNAV